MPRFKADIEFQVWCAVCGEGLCFRSKGLDHDKTKKIKDTTAYGLGVLIKPCPVCLKKAMENAVKKAKVACGGDE